MLPTTTQLYKKFGPGAHHVHTGIPLLCASKTAKFTLELSQHAQIAAARLMSGDLTMSSQA